MEFGNNTWEVDQKECLTWRWCNDEAALKPMSTKWYEQKPADFPELEAYPGLQHLHLTAESHWRLLVAPGDITTSEYLLQPAGIVIFFPPVNIDWNFLYLNIKTLSVNCFEQFLTLKKVAAYLIQCVSLHLLPWIYNLLWKLCQWI